MMTHKEMVEALKEGKYLEVAKELKKARENFAALTAADFREFTLFKSWLVKNGIVITDALLISKDENEIAEVLKEGAKRIFATQEQPQPQVTIRVEELPKVEETKQEEKVEETVQATEEVKGETQVEEQVVTNQEEISQAEQEETNQEDTTPTEEAPTIEEQPIERKEEEIIKVPVEFKDEVAQVVEEERIQVKKATSNMKSYKVQIVRGRQFKLELRRNGIAVQIPSEWDLEIDDRVLEYLVEKYVKVAPEKVQVKEELVDREEVTKPVEEPVAELPPVEEKRVAVTSSQATEKKESKLTRSETSKKEIKVVESDYFTSLVDYAYDLYKQGLPYQKMRQKVYDKMYNSKKVPEGYNTPGEATIGVLKALVDRLLSEGVDKETLKAYFGRSAKKVGLE